MIAVEEKVVALLVQFKEVLRDDGGGTSDSGQAESDKYGQAEGAPTASSFVFLQGVMIDLSVFDRLRQRIRSSST